MALTSAAWPYQRRSRALWPALPRGVLLVGAPRARASQLDSQGLELPHQLGDCPCPAAGMWVGLFLPVWWERAKRAPAT